MKNSETSDYNEQEAGYYAFFPTEIEGDVDFYVQEAKDAGSPVLELGVGTGRILIPIARAGIRSIGMDRSEAMLSVAREQIAKLDSETRGRIELVEGDVRNFTLNVRFNLIIMAHVFQHLLTPEDQRKALGRIREHLADNGRLILNIPDPRIEFIAAHLGPLGACPTKRDDVVHPQTGHRIIVSVTREYDTEAQTSKTNYIYEELDEVGRLISKRYSRYFTRYSFRYEMQHLLQLSGFQIGSLYGDFQRRSYHYGGQQVWVAHKSDH